MSVQALKGSFGIHCHWCGLPMDFAEPRSKPDSATIEHLHDATLGGVRKQKHRRLAHAICNQTRNEFRMQAERAFKRWIAERVGTARGAMSPCEEASAPATRLQTPSNSSSAAGEAISAADSP